MSKLTNRKVLLSRIQQAAGTPANPGVADAMLVSNLSYKPGTANMIKRDRAYPDFTQSTQGVEPVHSEISFDVDLSGSGSRGVPPLWGVHMRAAGCAEYVKDGAYTKYVPVSTGFEKLTHKFNWDGLEQVIADSMATMSVKMDAGKEPMLTFSYQGLFAPQTDTALENVGSHLKSFIDPETVNKSMTQCTLHNKTVVMNSFQFDLGNTLLFADKPGRIGVDITGRACTGKIQIEADTIAHADWVTRFRNKTLSSLGIRHGNKRGNRNVFFSQLVQLGEPTTTDVNGILHYDIPLYFTGTTPFYLKVA